MNTTFLPEIGPLPEKASPAEAGEDFVMPCSISQQRFWVLDQLTSGNSALNIPIALQLEGPLNVEIFHQALQAVVRRHEALRTSFAWIDEEVRQVISPGVQFDIQLEDLMVLPKDQRQERLLQEMTAEARLPVRLAKAPIFRAKLLRLDAEDHALLITLHHIICDGWANGVLIREMGIHYQAIREGKPPVLPALPIQYADYAVWQREWLKTPDFQDQLAFWEKQLTAAAPVLDFPTDRPRRDGRMFPAFTESHLLPIRLTDEAKRMCQDLDITMFMVLFATFASLLRRYTGQTRFIVGTTVANRNRPELENLIGQFANPMMLPADLENEPTFRELVYRVRDLSLATMSHQEVPFESILERLGNCVEGRDRPAIQAHFLFQKAFMQPGQYGELAIRPIRSVSPGTTFEFTMGIVERAEGIRLQMEYNTELLENATVRRMLRHFEALLEAALENLDTPVSELALLTDEERAASHERFDSSSAAVPSLRESFDRVTKSRASHPALTWGGYTWTFGDLAYQVEEWAQHLVTNLSPENSALSLIPESGPDSVVALLAALQSGRPLALFDPEIPRTEVEKKARSLGLTHLLCSPRKGSAFSPKTTLDKSNMLSEITMDKADSSGLKAKRGNAITFVPWHGSESNLLNFSFEQLDRLIASLVDSGETSLDSRVCVLGRLSSEAWVEQVLTTLTAGGTLVFPNFPLESSRHLLNLLREQRIDTLALAWPQSRALLALLARLDASQLALRRIIVDIDAVQVGDLLALQKRSGNRWEWMGRFALQNRPAAALARLIDGQWMIERSLAPSTLAVKDSHQQIVPFGVPGEVFIGSESAARAGKYLADGRMALLSPVAGRIKLHGLTFDLAELEMHLWNHPNVQEAVLINRKNAKINPVLTAYIVAIETKPDNESIFRQRLLEKLPPTSTNVEIVLLAKLPRHADGTIDREGLPLPPPAERASGASVKPRDAIELRLLTIWERVLNIEHVGIHDSFFDLAGNSLLAVRLLSEIEKAWDCRLPLRVIFHAPTIELMANVLRQGGWKAPSTSLLNVQPNGTRLPLFCISGIGGGLTYYPSLAKYLGPDQPIYAFHPIDTQLTENTVENEVRRNRLVETVQPYIKEIEAIQPIGPVCLCGHSWGGIVAYVLAQEFLARGREVGFLGLFDTYCPTYDYRIPFSKRLKYFLDIGWSERFVRAYRYARIVRLRLSRRILMALPDWILPNSLMKMKIIHLEARKDGLAIKNFELKSYPRTMTLFRGDYLSPWQRNDPDLGWSRWVTGDLGIIRVPGMHGNIVVEPQVQVLANRLKDCLEKATLKK
jgi:non-ribosomal peptide synthetase component F/thioesterase domain-containing protein